jgi:hypothetical protein
MKKLLLLIVFAGAAFGQVLPLPPDVDQAIAGTVNFEGTVTQGVTDLVTNVEPALMPFGWVLLGIFSVCALLQTLLQATLRQMSQHHYQPLAVVVAYIAILFRISIATVMMSFYMVKIPGLPFNFHQMFPYLSNALSNAITQDLLKQVIGHFNDAIHFLPAVGMFSVYPALIAMSALVLIGLAQVGMTIITAGSLAIVGVLTLCGPLMIPFYVLPGRDKKFWSWFDNMLAYSMYGFIGSAFIYVFCHCYNDLFNSLHGWGLGQWVWSILRLLLITVPFLWTMFKVPEVSHMIFGGVGGAAQGFMNVVEGLAVRAIAAAFL